MSAYSRWYIQRDRIVLAEAAKHGSKDPRDEETKERKYNDVKKRSRLAIKFLNHSRSHDRKGPLSHSAPQRDDYIVDARR